MNNNIRYSYYLHRSRMQYIRCKHQDFGLCLSCWQKRQKKIRTFSNRVKFIIILVTLFKIVSFFVSFEIINKQIVITFK